MADKIYFDMNDAERVFHRIAHDLDWAVTLMAEGFLMGHEEIQMEEEAFYKLYEDAERHMAAALASIYKLEEAVGDKEGNSR